MKKKRLMREIQELNILLDYQIGLNQELAFELERNISGRTACRCKNPHTLWELFKAEKGASSD